MIHLDTHVAVWLYAGQADRIPAAALRRIEGEPVVVSPMARLELTYLYEIGRLTDSSALVLDALSAALELRVSIAPFGVVVNHAVGTTWTRDPFDRMIAAHALADDADLLTADATIRRHLPRAVWD